MPNDTSKDKGKAQPARMSAFSAIINTQSGLPNAAGQKGPKRVFIYSAHPAGHTLALEQRPINGTRTTLRGLAVEDVSKAVAPVLKHPSSLVTLFHDDMVRPIPQRARPPLLLAVGFGIGSPLGLIGGRFKCTACTMRRRRSVSSALSSSPSPPRS